MLRLTITTLAGLIISSAATAGEYLVTLACHGVVDEPSDAESRDDFDSAPQVEDDPILYRLQTTATPGATFEVLIESGLETWELSGTLNDADDGRFHVELRHCHKTESGSVPSASGAREKIYDEMSVQTSVTLALAEPVMVGGMLSHSTDVTEGDSSRADCSRQRFVLRVTRDEPSPARKADSGN